jgi:hypothetical protein
VWHSGHTSPSWAADTDGPGQTGEFLEHLFRFQAVLPSSLHCKYVVTDDAVKDANMVLDAAAKAGIACPDVGTTSGINGHMRIADTIPKRGNYDSYAMRLSLKAVYKMASSAAVSVAQFQAALTAWIGQHAAHMSAKNRRAAAETQRSKAAWLFSWQKHAFLSRFGTNGNERWHRCV